jgi:hypothetical protein
MLKPVAAADPGTMTRNRNAIAAIVDRDRCHRDLHFAGIAACELPALETFRDGLPGTLPGELNQFLIEFSGVFPEHQMFTQAVYPG